MSDPNVETAELRDLVDRGSDLIRRWKDRAEAAEAKLATLQYAAKGGNATKGNVEAFRHAADELTRLGCPEKSFISALRTRAAMLESALSDTAQQETGDDR